MKQPVALTIAGSDSCGGAGLQADLRVFAVLGVRGVSVVAAVTAQCPKRVRAVEAVKPTMVGEQLAAVFEGDKPKAAKTGMLLTAGNVEVLAEWFTNRRLPLVVDPVMLSTSGTVLLKPSAMKALQKKLLPVAKLVTPNVPEAEAFTGLRIREPEDLRTAARAIYEKHGCAVLVKGGHLRGLNEAVDVLFDGRDESMLSLPRVKGRGMHGTGCVYSAAIVAGLAKGLSLQKAVGQGKEFVTREIMNSE
ncbi:MAG: bifunctional hydroxymethylpyrimidine kinase/phosphomethylpyrimidine kinase [Verrucomicrobia subdivision 3 bacterium]|nr:bifunctional hydroxymethylpyrimidine kinase/phosphomethylpyrimidine kinase [Limisphaerales bacterium]